MDWSTLKESHVQPYLFTKKLNVFEVDKISDDVMSAPIEAHEPAAQYNKVYDELTVITEDVKKIQLPLEQEPQPVVYDYIMGNPPFVGARMMNAQQKDDLLYVFGNKWKNLGNLDYVSGWYMKAAQILKQNSHTRAALVSTNSITQGEQVANLWKPLMEKMEIQINFAYRTFRWDSESDSKAHVHCVCLLSTYEIPYRDLKPFSMKTEMPYLRKESTRIC